MQSPIYRFGEFELDPASRELRHQGETVSLPPKSFECLVYLIQHRERAVGRDELISAVWGRVDASDAVVSQTLLRARRAIGDTGTEQSAVRTVTRFGYQWVAAVESVLQATDAPVQAPAATTTDAGDDAGDAVHEHSAGNGTPTTDKATPAPADAPALHPDHDARQAVAGRRRWGLLAIAAAIVATTLLVLGLWRQHSPPPTAGVVDLAVVLPVAVDAGGAEHAWIRLGAMDYIASLLRRNGGFTVLPSERLLHLVGEQPKLTPEAIQHLRATTRARWVLLPSAATVPEGWRVRIRVVTADDAYDIEARGGTPLEAAAAATSAVLRRLGRDSPSTPAPTALTQRLQQVDAELLAGQLDAARALIESAPAPQREDPQLRVREGQLEFRAGRLDTAAALFDRIVRAPATLPLEARSQALMGLGAVALRRQDAAESERRYDQAVQALEADTSSPADPALLGNAYNGRGVARVELGRIDEAIADLGRARIAMQRSGDEVEAASVGGNIGTLEARRGNATQAVQEFDQAIATFERFDVRDNLVVMLLAKADAELQLLQPIKALADSGRAMELGRELENPQLLAFMVATRAEALLVNGRLREADALLRKNEDATAALRLRLLLEHGRFQDAHRLVAQMLDQPEDTDAATLLLAVQAAIGGHDPALARQWLQSRAGQDAADADGAIELARALLAAAGDDQAAAERNFTAAVQAATRQSAPANEVRANAALAIHLVERGELDRASAVVGGLSPYADNDYRAARAALALYQALGDRDLQARAQAQVRRLAGERDPALPVVY